MKPSMGATRPQSSECCPQSIRMTVRNQLELLSAIAGILQPVPACPLRMTLAPKGFSVESRWSICAGRRRDNPRCDNLRCDNLQRDNLQRDKRDNLRPPVPVPQVSGPQSNKCSHNVPFSATSVEPAHPL